MSSTIPSLMSAASEGDADAVRSLIGKGAEVNETTQSGQTPLMRAVIGGHVNTVRLLLEAGADVRLKDRVGLTAIDWAERRGFWAMAQILTTAAAAAPSVPKPEVERQTSEQTATGSQSPQILASAGAATSRRDEVTVANRQRETAPPALVEEALRESATTTKSDRKWIEGLQRIMADQERRIKEIGVQRSLPESNILVDETVDVPALESRETTTAPERSEAVEAREQFPVEAVSAIEADAHVTEEESSQTTPTPEPAAVTEVRPQIPPEAEIAIEARAHGLVEAPSPVIAEPEPAEVAQVRQEFPIEAELLLGADVDMTLAEPSQLIAEPEPAEVEAPIQPSAPAARIATDQNIADRAEQKPEASERRESGTLDPLKVEAAEAAEVAHRESATEPMLLSEQDVGSPTQDLTDSTIDKELRPPEDMRTVEAELERLKARRKSAVNSTRAVDTRVTSPAMEPTDTTVEKEPPKIQDTQTEEAEQVRLAARKETERTREESRRRAEEEAFRRFQEEVVRKTQWEPSGNRTRSSRQSITPVAAALKPTPRESPNPTSWVRPTLWVLAGITLLGSAFVTYQLINRPSANEASSAPVGLETAAAPTAPKQNLPAVAGDLSGMEVSVPEAEYPPAARSEGVSGTVTVRVQVNKKGRVISVRSSKGDWRLRAAAVKAARKATFSPEKLADQDQRGRVVSGTITYNFLAPTESPATTASQEPAQTNSESATGSSATGSSASNVAGNYPLVGGALVGAEREVPQADYPRRARNKGNASIVTVVVRVNRKGKVISSRTLERDPDLRAAALRAARNATFHPDKLPGKGNVVGTISYNLKP